MGKVTTMNNTDEKIASLAKQVEEKVIMRRRDFHKHAESGWTEFRTASIIIETLERFGYEVFYGDDALIDSAMMGVPPQDVLHSHMKRAIAQGADPQLVEAMAGGKTAVIGIMKFAKPGPVVALRFDIDCNDVEESSSPEHYPNKEGFASINPGCMHACGHDCHTSVGLGVAEILSEIKVDLTGTVKLIFQPAEEGTRGAKSIVAKGFVDDVDYMIGAHVLDKHVGYVSYNATDFLATTKFDVTFTGVPAHAGASPEHGKNALLAAATAALNIHAISRHSEGASRVNVGVLQAGTGRNVIAGHARMNIETRGLTSKINDYVINSASRIIEGAAHMYDVGVDIAQVGGAASASNSPELSSRLRRIGDRLGIFDEVGDVYVVSGSEDFSYYMETVQQNGKQAAYLIYGGNTAAVNHNSAFDVDEACLVKAVQLLAACAADLLI